MSNSTGAVQHAPTTSSGAASLRFPCPAWCTDDHTTSGNGVHYGPAIQVDLAQYGGTDVPALHAQIARWDPEPTFPNMSHEIVFSAGGTIVELNAAKARTLAHHIVAFGHLLLAQADQLDAETAR